MVHLSLTELDQNRNRNPHPPQKNPQKTHILLTLSLQKEKIALALYLMNVNSDNRDVLKETKLNTSVHFISLNLPQFYSPKIYCSQRSIAQWQTYFKAYDCRLIIRSRNAAHQFLNVSTFAAKFARFLVAARQAQGCCKGN